VATLSFNQLTLELLESLVELDGPVEAPELWASLESTEVPPASLPLLDWVVGRVRDVLTVAANESTVWSRAIYPMLMLAEEQRVRAWSQVSLRAELERCGKVTELAGVIDGVLARESAVGGLGKPPFLLVIEAKRAMDATDPRPQVLGALLASLLAGGAPHGAVAECFGCLTVGDSWNFVRVEFEARPEAPRPLMRLAWSREYSQPAEAPRLLAVLLGLVRRHTKRT
jgi:hypothetical protein